MESRSAEALSPSGGSVDKRATEQFVFWLIEGAWVVLAVAVVVGVLMGRLGVGALAFLAACSVPLLLTVRRASRRR